MKKNHHDFLNKLNYYLNLKLAIQMFIHLGIQKCFFFFVIQHMKQMNAYPDTVSVHGSLTR